MDAEKRQTEDDRRPSQGERGNAKPASGDLNFAAIPPRRLPLPGELPATGRSAKAKVVIVGAGFAGLNAARALRRAPVEITIIDRHNYHCFQPLLYQVATATLSPADVAWPIRTLVRDQKNVTVLLATVTGVDATGKLIFADGRAFPFDYLILAPGATHSYFGHPEWAQAAPGLKTIEDATAIRRATLLAFEKAEFAQTDQDRKRYLSFVVVGGGPTGVEMAGAIAAIAQGSLHPDFRHIDARDATIRLIEAGPRILPALPPKLSDYAKRTLERLGVQVETSSPVTACTENGVETANGFIEAATIVWAAGVVASPAAQWLGVKADKAGRIEAAQDLSVTGMPSIFVAGDVAAVRQLSGAPVPGIAPAAKQMGKYVGNRIAAALAGKALPPFRYRHEGDLAVIGRGAAVVRIGRFSLKGFVGWLFWGAAHIFFLIGVRNRLMVAISWLWYYVTFQSGARLITGYAAPAQPAKGDGARPAAVDRTPARHVDISGGRAGHVAQR
ncbi:MAG: NAD(P)/FAD-dependent oxidoreductase [Rhodomicrobium sp.]